MQEVRPDPNQHDGCNCAKGYPRLIFQQKLVLIGSDWAFDVRVPNSAVNGIPTGVASGLEPTALLFSVLALASLAVTVPFAGLAVWVAKVIFHVKG